MDLYAFLSINGIYLLFSVPLITITYLLFKYVIKVKDWYKTDIVYAFLPGILYWVMDLFRLYKYLLYGKTMANLVAELMCIAIISFIIFVIRSLVGKYYAGYAKTFSLLSLVIMAILTLLIYIFTPSIPE